MKKLLFISVFCFSCFFVNAQVAADPHAGHDQVVTATLKPAAEETLALKETEFNFGKIPQGKPVTHIFEVSNTGGNSFKLDNVQASCGCTTPQWDKEKVINAGEKADITVGYNAAAEGPFTKTITVTYNGTQTKTIQIKGEVWKTPAASAPANAEINELKN